ncbi:MAG: HD domain-containing protein [Candidatus Edwardsbacteria bacterium]|jgi:tRNA nucleotidyltransferase/poly(A) polymerase|nr:HD domain-containing protein [Candidatus Edwardsbacteria bacterium]
MLPSSLIASINARGRLYEVGGAVRDRLRYAVSLDTGAIDPARFWGYAPEESDYLVTGMPLDELTGILRGCGRVELVGKAFGVLKFKLELADRTARTVDVALPRRERSTGRGHRDFEIEYDPDLPVAEDLRRRDFTINAIALQLHETPARAIGRSPLGYIIDPFGGLRDIRDNVIRMVDPAAFEQDPLRMLRACQFAARFEYALERGTFEAITTHAALVGTVPPERVQQELNKMLARAEQPSIGLWLMQRSGLMAAVLPELAAGAGVDQPGDFHRYDVFQHSIKTVDHVPRDKGLVLRLAALLHDVAKPGCRERCGGRVHFYGHDRQGELTARAVLERLRYPRDTVQAVCTLVRQHMFAYPETEKGLRRLIAKTGVPGLYDLIDLRRADILAQGRSGPDATAVLDQFEQLATAEIGQNRPFSLADLAVDGDDLQREFGLRPGPAVGRLLAHLLEHVLEHPARNHRDALLEEAARRLARAGGPP